MRVDGIHLARVHRMKTVEKGSLASIPGVLVLWPFLKRIAGHSFKLRQIRQLEKRHGKRR
jgi:hypothetical protein